ncbi:MAG: hypothetical protein VYB54_09640 [Pseudomonadota bacterium]|nr:hypothetical protein [Pseudomonadota bacterium]
MTTRPGLSMLAGLGSAASRDSGSGPADLPTNADLPPLGTAAAKDTGTGPTDVPTNADLPAPGVFTAFFESPEIAVATGDQVYEADHGLAGAPKGWSATLRCLTADNGYMPGDEVRLDSHILSFGGQDEAAVSVMANATKVRVNQDKALVMMSGTGTPAPFTITYANWRVVLRAWR